MSDLVRKLEDKFSGNAFHIKQAHNVSLNGIFQGGHMYERFFRTQAARVTSECD